MKKRNSNRGDNRQIKRSNLKIRQSVSSRGVLLDTCALVDFLNCLLPENIDDDLYRRPTYYSDESLREIALKKRLGELEIKKSITDIMDNLHSLNIKRFKDEKSTFEAMENLPVLTIENKKHGDTSDRCIISEAIDGELTLLSRDQKFSHYEKYGLDLLYYGD